MTNEEMHKAMEFILNQQTQSSAKIDGILEAQKESQKDAEQRWKRSEETWTRTEEGIRALLSIAEIHEREIATLGEQIAAVGDRIAAVSDNGRATDERLNALINTVERQISEGRNGKP
jgi:transposase